jgi:hypothetical protein
MEQGQAVISVFFTSQYEDIQKEIAKFLPEPATIWLVTST